MAVILSYHIPFAVLLLPLLFVDIANGYLNGGLSVPLLKMNDGGGLESLSRRAVVKSLGAGLFSVSAAATITATNKNQAFAADERYQNYPALGSQSSSVPRAKYPAFAETPSGLLYKDKTEGDGTGFPEDGDRVVIAWEGYTIGYFGRPFEMKSNVKGGAFDKDTDNLRFVLGAGTMVPAVEEAVKTMSRGGTRQIIFGPELGYPVGDSSHSKVGPKPSTFSGMRALNFVLENQGLIDKTLLINLTLVRFDKPGERGYAGPPKKK